MDVVRRNWFLFSRALPISLGRVLRTDIEKQDCWGQMYFNQSALERGAGICGESFVSFVINLIGGTHGLDTPLYPAGWTGRSEY